ncbi:hypothetical protein N7460_010890, partial [Penicillium canescens]
VHYGLGKPQEILHPNETEKQFLFLWLSIPLYNLSLTFTKASILLLYIRIFPLPRFILMSRIALGVISTYGLWCVLSSILNCIPVNAFWDTSIQGRCIKREFLWFFNAGINIVTDLGILVMPIPVLSHLQLSWKRKFGLILIFAAGGLIPSSDCNLVLRGDEHGNHLLLSPAVASVIQTYTSMASFSESPMLRQ